MALERGSPADREAWNDALLNLPQPHLLQSWDWGELKAQHGWKPERILWRETSGRTLAAAQVLTRRADLPLGSLRVRYVPRGPLLDWSDSETRSQVLWDLESLADETGVIQLKIDPDLPVGFGVPGEDGAEPHPIGQLLQAALEVAGWRRSPERIQFRNTMILDLTRTEDDILADMKQKTRYNVRLAGRRGVEIRRGTREDMDLLYEMYAETAQRDGFVIRDADYYHAAWGQFLEKGLAQPLIAEVQGEAVAGLVVYRFGARAWYLYGMSIDKHREKMPNYLLQWEAIRWAKDHGCEEYDLWGAPDTFSKEDPMWGVYRFKRGFQARVVRTLGAWDFTTRPLLHTLYHRALPPVLEVMRRLARRRVASELH